MIHLKKLINTNIADQQPLVTPEELHRELPASEKALNTVLQGRLAIENILNGRDNRKFIVLGPCSIHDVKAAKEYAERLKKLSEQVVDKLLLVMRVYFEKPRTTVGWKGLINDPDMDDSFHLEKGLKMARQLLIDVNEMGIPCGTEALDPITPQYLSELISWAAIGARTTESQTHREMASGLSMPVGFKNGTDGGIDVALNALQSVSHPHHFLGINAEGRISKFATRGNAYAHIVLRGGGGQPNYDTESIQVAKTALEKNGLKPNLVVDCSHANSNKDHKEQPNVFRDLLKQIHNGENAIVGFMLESHLHAGNQKIPENLSELQYGVSVTDKCIDWKTTEELVLEAYQKL